MEQTPPQQTQQAPVPKPAKVNNMNKLTCVLNKKLQLVTDGVPPTDEGLVFMHKFPGSMGSKLEQDVAMFKEFGIKQVVCLIKMNEFEVLGVDVARYKAAMESAGIQVVLYEMVEMGPPADNHFKFDKTFMKTLHDTVQKADTPVVVHCRVGVGRTGLVVAALLLRLGLFARTEEVVEFLRGVRHFNCVESKRQMVYLTEYETFLSFEAANKK